MNLSHQKDITIKVRKDNFFNKLLKMFSIKEKSEVLTPGVADEAQELIESIKSAKREWINANINFDYADDQELVDYYTYKIKACEVRYEYFIKKAKEKGIRLDSLDTAEYIYSRDHVSY